MPLGKRKKPAETEAPEEKRARKDQSPSAGLAPSTLAEPHESLVAKLQVKHDVLAISVISSSQIRKRVSYVTRHLMQRSQDGVSSSSRKESPLAVLYARPADVCKLITIVEHCKRVLKDEGHLVSQYNQLFHLPLSPKKADTVEETVLAGQGDEESSEDDGFERMESRLQRATRLPQRVHAPRSLRVILSCSPLPELNCEAGVTSQDGEGPAKPTN